MRKGILLLAMLFVALLGQAQLVLNEVSQGPSSSSKEYMEFVVVGTRTCTDSTADLRGWIVDDNNGWVEAGSGQGIAAGAIRFANVANWSKVPYGSIIVIYNEDDKNTKITIADDPTDANHDYVYVMAASSPQLERNFTAPAAPSSASFTYPTTGWGQGTAADWHWGTVALANSGDAIITVKPTNLSSAHFSFAFTTGSAATATVWVADMPGGKELFKYNCQLYAGGFLGPGRCRCQRNARRSERWRQYNLDQQHARTGYRLHGRHTELFQRYDPLYRRYHHTQQLYPGRHLDFRQSCCCRCHRCRRSNSREAPVRPR
jgi:hypothetical protein